MFLLYNQLLKLNKTRADVHQLNKDTKDSTTQTTTTTTI